MMTGKLIGPSGVELKFSGPLKCYHNDIYGAIVNWLRRLSVSLFCVNSWSNRKLGKELEIQARIAINSL